MKAKEKNLKTEKEKDLTFIKTITNITVKGLCSDEHIDRVNVYTMKTSKEKLHNIKENIDKKIKDAYIEYGENNSTL